MPSKRIFLSLKEKIEVINSIEKDSLSVLATATKFKISKTQAAEIAKNKATIKAMWCSGKSSELKKNLGPGNSQKIDDKCLDHIISKIDEKKTASELVKSMNVLEAVYFISSAWKSVSAGTIQHCFHKAGFVKQSQDEFDLEDDLPLATISKSFGPHTENISTIFDIDEHLLSSYADFDNFLCTEEPVSTDSINVELTVDVVSSSEEEEEIILPEDESDIKSIPKALKVLQSLKNFAKNEYKVFEQIKNVESYYQDLYLKQKAKNSHQTTISSYFKQI